jgi:ribosome-binding factor A
MKANGNDSELRSSRPRSHRPQRMADNLRSEIASFILNGVKNDRIGFVTITEVKMTPDLQIARVYYTAYGSDHQKEESARGLAESSARIRAHLGKVLRMKYTPRLEFFYDKGLEHSYKIQSLLNSVKYDGDDKNES